MAGAAARGEERARTITLDSESLTIMINVVPNDDGTYRLDGWLAPPARHPIELRTGGRTLVTEADVRGRFAFEAVAADTVQVVVRSSPTRTVTTPTFSL